MQFVLTNPVIAPPEYIWTCRIQNLLTNTFWPKLSGNCHLNRPIGEQIKNSALFSSTDIVEFSPIFKQFMMGIPKLLRFEIYGWATK